MIVGIFSGLLSTGGIDRIGRHVGAVLALYAEDKTQACHMLSLNDAKGIHQVPVGKQSLAVEGFNRDKFAFILAVIRLALRMRVVYIGHVNLSPINIFLCLLPCRSIVATHGVEVWEPLPWWRRWGLHLATLVTAPSSFTAARLENIQGLNPKKIYTLPWGLDPGFPLMAQKEQVQAPQRPPGKIILTVSRLAAADGYKGIDTTLRALPLVKETLSDFSFIILGDGDDRHRLEQMSKDLGVEDRVMFKGSVSDLELHGYFHHCDVFVMPSGGEGFGLVYIEAMAFGKPVVGAKYGGTLDVIVEGDTGFMVQYGDVSGIAQCLVRLLTNEDLRSQMGEAGRKRVHELYTFPKFQKELLAVLNGEVT